MNNLPTVSILVVNYNGKQYLEEFLNSALHLDYPKEKYDIVIVDNGSKDGSVDFINNNYTESITGRELPLIKVVGLDENLGFTGGNNQGAKYCTGEYLALINNDTLIDRKWLIELVEAAMKYPDAIYGSKMLWYAKKDMIVYGGGKLLAWGWPMHLWLWENDANDHRKEPEKTFYADGCGFLVSKEIYLEIGGFDESYFAYAEDYELSWKARLSGYEAYFVPTAKFYHKISSTKGEFSSFHVYYIYRNHLRSIIKFAAFPTYISMIPLFILHGISNYLAIYIPKERKFRLIFPLFRAYIDVFLDLPRLIRTRNNYQKKRKVKDKKFKEEGLIMSFKDSIKEVHGVLERRKLARNSL